MPDDETIPDLIDNQPSTAKNVLEARVPLTLICGFLGAGKSTFLKRILSERHGQRIAVILNEFGDTADIESQVINTTSVDNPTRDLENDFLELANGCLCCSIKDSGIAAIEKLMRRKGAFDHILLETTGLADPGPIASIFWQNEEFAQGLGQDIFLDGVICVVDAVFGEQQMKQDQMSDGIGESLRQIAGSDVILLNKTDLVSNESLLSTERLIHQVNPAAPVYHTIRGEIDLKLVMGIDAYSSRPVLQIPAEAHGHVRGDEHSHPHLTHYEVRGITSLQVNVPALSPKRLAALDEWIRTVLWENQLPERPSDEAPDAEGQQTTSLEVLRCKGLFLMEDGTTYVLQGVRNLYELTEVSGDTAYVGVSDCGKLVLIGTGLNDAVRSDLLRLLTQ